MPIQIQKSSHTMEVEISKTPIVEIKIMIISKDQCIQPFQTYGKGSSGCLVLSTLTIVPKIRKNPTSDEKIHSDYHITNQSDIKF